MAKHYETDWAGHPPGKVRGMEDIVKEVRRMHNEGLSLLTIAISTGHPISRIRSIIEREDMVEDEDGEE